MFGDGSGVDRRAHHIDEQLPLGGRDCRPGHHFPGRRRRSAPNRLALCWLREGRELSSEMIEPPPPVASMPVGQLTSSGSLGTS